MVVVNRRILPVFFNIAMEAVAHLWRIYLLNKVVFNSYVLPYKRVIGALVFIKTRARHI
jgi:hypothetical protein